MAMITIPKKFANKGDLVVLPRKEYDALLRSANASIALPKRAKKLSVGLRQALREVAEGKLSGPFDTAEEFMAHLQK